MLQQVMTNPGEIIFREVPVPEVKENQVLVQPTFLTTYSSPSFEDTSAFQILVMELL